MILIVGLGNPGTKYENTRHNVGFMAVDLLLKKLTSVEGSIWEENKKFNCLVAKIDKELVLAKPLSFMNASGEAVGKLMRFFKVTPFGLYVIHDDIDLPLEKIKITHGHGSAGHKGVDSIIENLKSNNFVRIRVGIGSDKRLSTEKFVLSEFKEREKSKIKRAVKKAQEAMEFILKNGVERAASQFNL